MELCSLQPYAGKRICVAVSGGIDSVSLLHYFLANAERYRITLSAVTCEHGIRGEASLADLRFVENLCGEWNVPLRIFRADVPSMAKTAKVGLEEAGRNFRYACFDAVLHGTDGADFVATAHHRDDFIETVLFRLLRGTSSAGLNVFPEREGLVRPLVNTTRAQIEEYAEENALDYVTDASNSDETYTRNFLRHTVIPALEKAVNGAGEHLAELAERVVRDDDFLQTIARDSVEYLETGEPAVSVDLPSPIFNRACVSVLRQLGVVKDYTGANIREISALKTLQSGKRACLPCGLSAIREYGKIVFYRPHSPTQRPFPGELPFGTGMFSLNGTALIVAEETDGEAVIGRPTPDSRQVLVGTRAVLKVDLDAFPPGCVIRTRREGDTITPYGGGSKSLKKFFTDKKISARRGRIIPLVANGNEVLAVCGVEISEKVKVTALTKRIGYLSL